MFNSTVSNLLTAVDTAFTFVAIAEEWREFYADEANVQQWMISTASDYAKGCAYIVHMTKMIVAFFAATEKTIDASLATAVDSASIAITPTEETQATIVTLIPVLLMAFAPQVFSGDENYIGRLIVRLARSFQSSTPVASNQEGFISQHIA